jgi:co-chaperonin GroES (HSP10)
LILTSELEDVAAHTRVLRDRVLVKPLPYVHPTLATPGIEIQKGVVVAVGYGRRQRRKVAFKQQVDGGEPVLGPDGKTVMKFGKSQLTGKTLYFEDGDETGKIIPMQVKPGDVVEFSFRNITLVDFDRVGFNGIGTLAFVWQKAIYSVDPDESLNDCLLWQQSAGYDRNGNWMSGAEDWHRA